MESDDNQLKKSGPIPPKIDSPQPLSLNGTTQLNLNETRSPTSTFPEFVDDKEKPKESKKKKKTKINQAEIIRRWIVVQRRSLRSLQVLMSIEFKTNVFLTPINTMHRKYILELLNGQISYLQEMIIAINKGDDKLSQELMEIDFHRRASTQVFETLKEIIEEEKNRLIEEKPNVIDIIEKDLKRFKDARLEPKACFWILWSVGMQLKEIHSKVGKSLDVVLEVILRYPTALKRALGVFLHFAFNLVKEFHPYPIDTSRTNLIIGPGGTGYNMAPWIKYRYGTNSQSYMEYERYLEYYARSFGTVSGNAPNFTHGPKDGYHNWIQRSLNALEKTLQKSPIIVSNSRGSTLEGMLAGMMDELKEDLKKREFIPAIDPTEDDKLINQPIGGEGALKFIEWLFETAIQRFITTNIASHGKVRLSLDMFKFITGTRDAEFPVIRWENELGERLVHDWLDPDE